MKGQMTEVEARKAMGANVRKFRIAKGMTQKELSDATGINRTSIVQIEAGKRVIYALELSPLANALDVRIMQIYPYGCE